MKKAIQPIETISREDKLMMMAENMIHTAADLHRLATALKSEINSAGLTASIPASVAKRNSKIKIVPTAGR